MALPQRAGAPRPDARPTSHSSSAAGKVFRFAALLVGLFVGLRLALPGTAVSATALVEIAGVMLAFWLIAEGVLAKAPSLRRERGGTQNAGTQKIHARAGDGATPATTDDPLLAAATWGVPAPKTDRAQPVEKVDGDADHDGEPAQRTAIIDPLLMAASWGSAGPADPSRSARGAGPSRSARGAGPSRSARGAGKREHGKPRPAPAQDDETPPAAPSAADPLLAAASWNASPTPPRERARAPRGAGARRMIDSRVLPRLRLPSLRLPRPSRLLPSRLTRPSLSAAGPAGRRVVHVALLLVGVVIGLLWALPIADVSKLCPPQGEGQVMCTIQKAWLAALVKFAAPVVTAQLLAVLTLRTIPAAIRRWQAGERPARRAVAAPSEHFADDPALRAAAWGRTGEDEAEVERSPDRELVERVRTPRVVPVRSAPRAGDRG